MRLALFQPDIAPNAGAMMRLAACLDVGLDVIEPAGFVMTDARLRRSGMDYLDMLDWARHASWNEFVAARGSGRLVLLTTRAAVPFYSAEYRPDDTLLVGRETGGVPDFVHDTAELAVRVPVRRETRSLNVALAAAIVLGEALRQLNLWPGART